MRFEFGATKAHGQFSPLSFFFPFLYFVVIFFFLPFSWLVLSFLFDTYAGAIKEEAGGFSSPRAPAKGFPSNVVQLGFMFGYLIW